MSFGFSFLKLIYLIVCVCVHVCVNCQYKKHPGGVLLITSRAGKDVTADFDGMFHSALAADQVRHLCIGRLAKSHVVVCVAVIIDIFFVLHSNNATQRRRAGLCIFYRIS